MNWNERTQKYRSFHDRDCFHLFLVRSYASFTRLKVSVTH